MTNKETSQAKQYINAIEEAVGQPNQICQLFRPNFCDKDGEHLTQVYLTNFVIYRWARTGTGTILFFGFVCTVICRDFFNSINLEKIIL